MHRQSDYRLKTDISETELGLRFVRKLKPVQYRWKETMESRTGVRTHHGFIAQDVRNIISEECDFGGYTYDETNDIHLLRYEEFIAPIVSAIQTIADKIDEFERRLDKLESYIKGDSTASA